MIENPLPLISTVFFLTTFFGVGIFLKVTPSAKTSKDKLSSLFRV